MLFRKVLFAQNLGCFLCEVKHLLPGWVCYQCKRSHPAIVYRPGGGVTLTCFQREVEIMSYEQNPKRLRKVFSPFERAYGLDVFLQIKQHQFLAAINVLLQRH